MKNNLKSSWHKEKGSEVYNSQKKRVAEATLKVKTDLLLSEILFPFLFGLGVIEDPCCYFFRAFLK